MVQCCNPDCVREWIHIRCAKMSSVPSYDWYCSRDCQESEFYVYCLCQRHTSEDSNMIQCARKSDCFRYQFYHPSCIPVQAVTGICCKIR